ncbi:MAG: GlcG/HbpS family heme-binding protein, partial [Janthinobacterium lividum]
MKRTLALLASTLLAAPLLAATAAHADPIDYRSQCALPQAVVVNVQRQLQIVVQMNNGGIFKPSRMWSAVVDRAGVLCSVAKAG